MNRVHRYGFIALVVMLVLSVNIAPLKAQTFSSGSNGSDGALNLTTPGTILFDPASFATPLDLDDDGVYHFTTINIAAGVTVRLRADILGTIPVVWLATSGVTIDGVLDLNGNTGYSNGGLKVPAIAGAGGFNGGIGKTEVSPPTPGLGPGGGGASASVRGNGGGGGHSATGTSRPNASGEGGKGGQAYGNDFLLPLLAGSGGGGATWSDSNGRPSSGGGAGGGAILIASSFGITLNGTISVNGGKGGLGDSIGAGGHGGGGSGGSIRLIAPTILGSGSVSAQSGDGGKAGRGVGSGGNGSIGRIRIEAFQHNFTGTTSPFARFVTPGIIFPPAGSPSVRVTQVAGTPVPAKTRASFNPADLTINESGAVAFQIEAHNIPTGTAINLRMWSETGGTVNFTSQPLAGTLATSTATATTTIPHGFSRFTVEATWTPTP